MRYPLKIGQWLPDLAGIAFGGVARIGQDFSLKRVTLLDLAELVFQGSLWLDKILAQELRERGFVSCKVRHDLIYPFVDKKQSALNVA